MRTKKRVSAGCDDRRSVFIKASADGEIAAIWSEIAAAKNAASASEERRRLAMTEARNDFGEEDEMTVPDYLNVAVNGVPLVFVIMGLTYLYGMFGAKGKLQLGLSVGTGLLVGGGWMISQNGMPVDFAGWFGAGVFAIAMGLLPAGTYESVKEAARKSRE